MVHDLNLVIGKYVTDAKKDPEAAVPFKITRSVGLQVRLGLIFNWKDINCNSTTSFVNPFPIKM
jgi:hypothetical protein